MNVNVGQDSLFSVFCVVPFLVKVFTLRSALKLSSCFPLRDARVVKDTTTGKSKGYGFVSFYNKLVRLQCNNTD